MRLIVRTMNTAGPFYVPTLSTVNGFGAAAAIPMLTRRRKAQIDWRLGITAIAGKACRPLRIAFGTDAGVASMDATRRLNYW